MRYLKDRGFVLKRVNFSESDRYITIFTKFHGKIEVVAKGVRKITSKRASHIETINLIEFQSIKGNKNYILTEATVAHSYGSLKKDLASIEKVFVICELINLLCPLHEKHTEVFVLLERLLEAIDTNGIGNVSFLKFQQDLLVLLGFWDEKESLTSDREIQYFIENIVEKKLKSKSFSAN